MLEKTRNRARHGYLLDPLEAAITQAHGVDADVGVKDLTAARVDLARTDAAEQGPRGRHPADRGMARIERVPVGVVRLDLGLYRILEADLFECLVPFQDAVDDRLAILFGNVAVEPVHDRLLRLGHLRRRILLFQAPAMDIVHARR